MQTTPAAKSSAPVTVTSAMRAALAAAIAHAGGVPEHRFDYTAGDLYVIVYGTRQNGVARVQVTTGGVRYDAPVRANGTMGRVRFCAA